MEAAAIIEVDGDTLANGGAGGRRRRTIYRPRRAFPVVQNPVQGVIGDAAGVINAFLKCIDASRIVMDDFPGGGDDCAGSIKAFGKCVFALPKIINAFPRVIDDLPKVINDRREIIDDAVPGRWPLTGVNGVPAKQRRLFPDHGRHTVQERARFPSSGSSDRRHTRAHHFHDGEPENKNDIPASNSGRAPPERPTQGLSRAPERDADAGHRGRRSTARRSSTVRVIHPGKDNRQ